MGQFNNDGKLDIYVGSMYSKAGARVIGNMWPGTYSNELKAKIDSFVVGNRLHRNLGGLKFEDVKEAVKEVYGGKLREAVTTQMRARAKIEIVPQK